MIFVVLLKRPLAHSGNGPQNGAEVAEIISVPAVQADEKAKLGSFRAFLPFDAARNGGRLFVFIHHLSSLSRASLLYPFALRRWFETFEC